MINLAILLLTFFTNAPSMTSISIDEENCDLSKEIEFGLITIKHSEKWKSFTMSNTLTIIYNSEDNWERREDVELNFFVYNNSDFTEDKFLGMQDLLASKVSSELGEKGSANFSRIEDSRETFSDLNWKKIVTKIDINENGKTSKAVWTSYFYYQNEYQILIQISESGSKISEIDNELKCILNSLKINL